VSFAFQIDRQRALLRARFGEIAGTSLAAAGFGLFGSAAAARALGASRAVRLMVLPRMVTAPLAVPIADMLGADVAMAATVVALTGLLGANVARACLTVMGVKDPVVRGLAAGTAAHGLGTAAMADEPAAFPFAALGMALVGIFSTMLVASPAVKGLLLRVALGKLAGGRGV
jgi:putative effector of murein hydrolase